jgi:hypothetical protein
VGVGGPGAARVRAAWSRRATSDDGPPLPSVTTDERPQEGAPGAEREATPSAPPMHRARVRDARPTDYGAVTVIVPVKFGYPDGGWLAQWYVYVPGVSNVRVYVDPCVSPPP